MTHVQALEVVAHFVEHRSHYCMTVGARVGQLAEQDRPWQQVPALQASPFTSLAGNLLQVFSFPSDPPLMSLFVSTVGEEMTHLFKPIWSLFDHSRDSQTPADKLERHFRGPTFMS